MNLAIPAMAFERSPQYTKLLPNTAKLVIRENIILVNIFCDFLVDIHIKNAHLRSSSNVRDSSKSNFPPNVIQAEQLKNWRAWTNPRKNPLQN